ncbi:MAG: hypothetical protein IPK83_23440 [Planctomycetes bacterium]|nr:hypothetical protein [Planctomycetota bacterium]
MTDLKRVWCGFRARRRSRIETQNGEYNWSSRLIGRIQPFIDPRAFLLAWLGFMPFCCCLGMAPLSLLSHEYAKPRAVNWEFYEILGRVLYWPIILADSKSILKEANVLLVFAVQYGYFYLIALAFVKLSTRR